MQRKVLGAPSIRAGYAQSLDEVPQTRYRAIRGPLHGNKRLYKATWGHLKGDVQLDDAT